MKYYIINLYERNGEYEYTHTMRLVLSSRQKPEVALKRLAKTWYSDKGAFQDGQSDGWYFNCGGVYVEPQNWKEISKSAFDELAGILA